MTVDTAAPGTKQVILPLSKAVAEAGRLYGLGEYRQAEALCRQIVAHHPREAEAHNVLGASLSAQGQLKDAAAALRQAVKLAPDNASFHANLGEIERRRGRPIEARQALAKAIALDPRQASAHNNMGILHFDRGDYRAAVESYGKAVAIHPGFAEAHNNLGNASRFVGEQDAALGHYHKALQFREVYPEAYNNLGTLLRDQGKLQEAEHAYRKAMLQNPNYIEAYNNLANLLYIADRDQEALRVLGDALRVDENNPATLTITGRVQIRRGNWDAAERACKLALDVDPKFADALVVLGQLYHEIDRYDEAIEVLERAVELAPGSAEARNFHGVALKSVGRLEEGKRELLKALEINGDNYGAYANLNDLIDFKEAPALVARMEAIFAAADDPDDPRYLALHFGFGKALEDLGDYPRALDHYMKGARAKRRQLTYAEDETVRFFEEIKAVFGPEQFRERRYPGLGTDRMIFIVGMPRSGSTLVEQVLSAHPDIHAAGEVKYLATSIAQVRDRFPSIPRYPELFRHMEEFHFNLLGRSYLKQIAAVAGDRKRVSDKLLTNYFFVGLINILFPNARIIHTMRNPVDTCLSAFTKLFKDDMPHSYDFGELGRYYRQYQALMAHWRDVLPEGAMLDMRYEDVVADVEGKARELIDFVGLDWDPACVDFHKSNRPVKTASVAQVRKPVYAQSVERWRRYGSGLQPLVDALGYKVA